MAAATGYRKSTASINDYPEHLNPFHDDDNHNKIRFWTISRKTGRSNSFSLNNIKDFRNTWSLKSFMKKNKKGDSAAQKDHKPKTPVNGEPSPIVYRRAVQYGVSAASTEGSPSPSNERYVYGGSVTPLPRSRFQERIRSTPPTPQDGSFRHLGPGRASFSHRTGEPYALPGLARNDVNSSRLSVESTNPFDDSGPIPAVRRKKKRAAPLPPGQNGALPASATNGNLNSTAAEDKEEKGNIEIDDLSLNIELKIVEDVEDKPTKVEDLSKLEETPTETELPRSNATVVSENHINIKEVMNTTKPAKTTESTKDLNNADNNKPDENDSTNNDALCVEIRNKKVSEDSDNNDVVFEKVNIRQYRRNSSINADIINLRNEKTEVNPLTNKRCKSLSNTINSNNNFTTYDITLHIDEDNNELKDINDNPPPQRVVCKLLDNGKPRKESIDNGKLRKVSRDNEYLRKASIDNSISSTEREFNEIDRATRELEIEINKLNSSVKIMNNSLDDNYRKSDKKTVSEIKSRFENPAMYSPNPIPKPRRSRAGSTSPVNPRID